MLYLASPYTRTCRTAGWFSRKDTRMHVIGVEAVARDRVVTCPGSVATWLPSPG